jgi:hypothetical protein
MQLTLPDIKCNNNEKNLNYLVHIAGFLFL